MAIIFEISVPSARTVNTHTEYQLTLISNIPGLSSSYIRASRRYSHLRSLHLRVSKWLPLLPPFPGKVWFGNRSHAVVESRRQAIEVYLRRVFEFIVRNELLGERRVQEIFDFLEIRG